MKRLLTITITIGMILAACGGSTSTTSSDAREVASPEPTPTPVGVAQPTPAPSPQPEADDEAPSEPATPISTVLADEPEPGGWPVPAGRWSTDAFEVPVEFTTSTDMLLVRESHGALWLRTPGSDERTRLILSTAAFVNSGAQADPQLPPPGDADAIDERFENGRFSTLIDSGTATLPTRELPWWDYELRDETGGSAWLCAEAQTCLLTSQTVGGERVIMPTEQQLRLYLGSTDDVRLGAWLAAPDASMPDLQTLAEDILDELSVIHGPPAPAPPIRSLTAEGVATTALPTGRTVALVGAGLLSLETDEAPDGIGLDVVNDRAVVFATENGYLAILSTSGLVPGDIDVTSWQDWASWDLVDADDPETFDAWVESSLGVTETGAERLFGDQPARWWDITPLDPDNSVPCGAGIEGVCDLLHVSDLGIWAFADGDRNRLYHVPAGGIMVHVEALDGTVSDILGEAAALLDAMTITPIA